MNSTKLAAEKIKMLSELLKGQFAPDKFDKEEKRELAEVINGLTTDTDEAFIHYGMAYIRSESGPSNQVPVRWLTTKDFQYLLDGRKGERQQA